MCGLVELSSGETDAGHGADFPLPEEQPVKRAHLLCVWLQRENHGQSMEVPEIKILVLFTKEIFITQPSKKGNPGQSVPGTWSWETSCGVSALPLTN